MNYLELLALEQQLLQAEGVNHLITMLRAFAARPKPECPSEDYAAGMTAGAVVLANVLSEMFSRAPNKSGVNDTILHEFAAQR